MQLVLFPRAAPIKFVARLCCILLYSVFFCFACFASQTSGLGSAFPSVPVESVTRFCYALLVTNLFCLFCLTNTGFVQCYSLGSRKVCCTLVFNFALFSNFCFACFASHANIGLVQCFPFGSPQVYTLLVFFILFSLLLLCALCPTSSALCSDFSPAPLEFARFNFLLCIIQL